MKSFFKISVPVVIHFIAVLWIGASVARAETPQTAHDPAQTSKIQITSDQLLYDREKTVAEFSGNVRAVQDDKVITAASLKIFHTQEGLQGETRSAAIEKIVASGNVVIHFDNRVAQAEQAVFVNKTKVLILSGSPARVVSGSDTISGDQITYYQTNGRLEVESGQGRRVEAQFQTPSEQAP